MTSRADTFALQFAILFLSILLAMFLLFHLMRAYDGTRVADTWLRVLFAGSDDADSRSGAADSGSEAVFNFTEAFHVNLFLINLSLLLVVESLLIFLFIRFTVPAMLISCAGVLGVMGFGRGLLTNERLNNLVLLLAHNQYAYLSRRDGAHLFALNALLIAFLVALMHHYRLLEVQERLAKASGTPPDAEAPPAGLSVAGPASKDVAPESVEAAPGEAAPADTPKEPPSEPPPMR
jgi:hypothetical protein